MKIRKPPTEIDPFKASIEEVEAELDRLGMKPAVERAKRNLRLVLDNKKLRDKVGTITKERDRLFHMLVAAGFIGKGTQIIGDKRYEQLLAAEKELATLRTKTVTNR